MNLTEIAKVKSKYKEPIGPDKMKKSESVIEVKEEFVDGLYGIEAHEYLQILFYFHKSEGYDLISKRRIGGEKGLFASRSPRRPSGIGITTVELLKREGNKLYVYGLDAIDGTPVVDIKPYASFMDEASISLQKNNPRYKIEKMISYQNIDELLLKAGELHGHYCPFLALGVLAAADALKRMQKADAGMEKLLAVVETNSCFSDGIQVVSGATFANNALIYRDLGKTAVTFVSREGGNLRYYLENDKFLEKDYAEAKNLFEKVVARREGSRAEEKELKELWQKIAFEIIEEDIKKYFKIEKDIEIEIPDYAPIFEDKYCQECGEKIMAVKAVEKEAHDYCKKCAQAEYMQLDGSGLSLKKFN
ncbi:MAG: tRNA (N6-threonylcarbamoyladenosine(37)-N6)-methyltransferase TrmO [Halanaerobium sp. MSAO_Bac5]|nr:MAG: tRNA (N6-threonylcarbamoyladenosine(37)-N6)-methyltransferase TrmO [Halanaerobium sp. MSAO_Bac5]